ncbi:hypothetical protein PCASD_22382 [Puccinia coronata f. sp. avenae]|uniref:BED-type domain-containing protein n=1 Tax=Puccinia coronata f. sp. avenae TaxID=200324 RepID=A0A2N5SEY0_9BASI|nr:hypothetical protein PCASD_22382 [Puccinia coronata f. sp. avenae]
MAQIEEVEDDVPSTPPNTTGSDIPGPQSVRRESTCLRTPINHLGFIPTYCDSCRALVPMATTDKTQKSKPSTVSHKDQLLSGTTNSGNQVVDKNNCRDSDEENRKAGKKKAKGLDKDGYKHPTLYFYPRGKGPKQKDTQTTLFQCQWCLGELKTSGNSSYNLKTHQDGGFNKGTNKPQPVCNGCSKAIASGCKLPPTATQIASDEANANPLGSGKLIAFTPRGFFDNTTLKKLIVIWIINSCIWAASHAHQLYLEQQLQVIKAIKASDSQISLVLDVWRTKGSHKAFVGITCCYITQDSTYMCRHLATNLLQILPYVLAQSTDLGSNNFAMAKGVASIFQSNDHKNWDVQKNHHQCICHVIALILGAGLKALKLSNHMVRPEKTDKYFPTLDKIAEDKEEAAQLQGDQHDIIEVTNDKENGDKANIDPEDAEKQTPVPGWEWDDGEDEEIDNSITSGIGFTLKKIHYICREISTSPQKQAEWKLWASKLGYKGRGVIGGYRIQ